MNKKQLLKWSYLVQVVLCGGAGIVLFLGESLNLFKIIFILATLNAAVLGFLFIDIMTEKK